MAKRTISRNSTAEREEKQKIVMGEEYFNYRSFKKDFMTNKMMEFLAKELTEYVEGNDEVIKINQFLAFKGISERTWHRWYTKYDFLEEAKEHAKTILGNRREAGLISRKFEPTSTAKMMVIYDKDWIEANRINKKEEESSGTKVVVLERYPEVASVPRRE